MKDNKLKKTAIRRKYHVRKKVFGSRDRPRLTVFRSNRHIYVQVIDDTEGATLVSACTRSKALRSQLSTTRNKKAAEIIGEAIAKQALAVGIKCVCFDRNRYKYHGRVKVLADAARKVGLVF